MISPFDKIIAKASEILLDKETEIKLSLVCLLAKGHLLIEDQPGVGKTTLSQVLGKLCGFKSSRIQFTSDLLPADILGNSIWNEKTNKFEFHPGPIFSQLVLADELNRTSPRTQSALLQAMEEQSITVDGKNYELPSPFFVIATQNPISQIGTYSLPESQLDRFMMNLEIRPASAESEKILFKGYDPRHKIRNLEAEISEQDFLAAQEQVEKIIISENVASYILAIIQTAREDYPHEPISTRSGMSLAKAGRALAFLMGQKAVTPENIQFLAKSVLGHRLSVNSGIQKGRQRVEGILHKVAVPV